MARRDAGRKDALGQTFIDWAAAVPPAEPTPREARHRPVPGASAESTPKLQPRRVIARLPVPRPLPEAVAAGRFGTDEAGRPVRPGPAEVRAITENHAEKLIELLEDLQRAPPTDGAMSASDYAAAVVAYAEDFGNPAAWQLEAYVRRQMQQGKSGTSRTC